MKIIDISNELLSARAYFGDKSASLTAVATFDKEGYRLSELELSAHSGTHLDAPSHFIDNGKNIADIDLTRCYGRARVVCCEGDISAEDIRKKAEGCSRLLVKGKGNITIESARELNKLGIRLIGTENLSVGDEMHPKAVHIELLSNNVVLLENLNLSAVTEGEYTLCAFPLKIAECEGAPCRAVLIVDD